MGLGMSSRAGLPHFRGKRGDPSERPPRRHETTFLLGLVAFAIVLVIVLQVCGQRALG